MRHLVISLFAMLSMSSTMYAAEGLKNTGAEATAAKLAGTKAVVDSQCGSLTGRTLAYVCNRLSDSNLTVQCFQAGREAYLDECALGACDRYLGAQTTVECVQSIADREYTLEEVLTCDRMIDANQTNNCFAAAGRWASRGANVSEIRLRVLDALDYTQAGDSGRAEAELVDLLNYIDRAR